MRAASENLVPVTLELGGKSPIIVDRRLLVAVPRRDASRLASAPMAGRFARPRTICSCPRDKAEDFVAAYRQEVDTLYPDVAGNSDFTWTLNDRHFARLSGLVEDAKAKGARVIELGAGQSSDSTRNSRRPYCSTSLTRWR